MGARPDALKAAIDEAWRAFDIPAPADLGICTGCCMDPIIAEDMRATPARMLSHLQVREWYGASFDPAPTHGQVAWLLPRAMEILADGREVAAVGNEVAFRRLPLAGFPDKWPERQVSAVNRFALAFLEAKLIGKPPLGWGELDRILCMFGEGRIDMEPLLHRLDALPDDLLADLLHRTWFYMSGGKMHHDAFWECEPAKSKVWGWYTSEALLNRMEQGALGGNETALDVHALIAETRTAQGL